MDRTDPAGTQFAPPEALAEFSACEGDYDCTRDTAYRASREAAINTAGLVLGEAFGAAVGYLRGAIAGGAWAAVNESMSARALQFQVSQGGRVGQAYVVNGVKFDGVIGRSLMEAKSGYGQFVGKNGEFASWFANSQKGGRALVAQATRQVAAAGDTKVVWRVDTTKAANAIRALLKQNEVKGVDVQVAEHACTGTRICP